VEFLSAMNELLVLGCVGFLFYGAWLCIDQLRVSKDPAAKSAPIAAETEPTHAQTRVALEHD